MLWIKNQSIDYDSVIPDLIRIGDIIKSLPLVNPFNPLALDDNK